jgi:hypothetical protein
LRESGWKRYRKYQTKSAKKEGHEIEKTDYDAIIGQPYRVNTRPSIRQVPSLTPAATPATTPQKRRRVTKKDQYQARDAETNDAAKELQAHQQKLMAEDAVLRTYVGDYTPVAEPLDDAEAASKTLAQLQPALNQYRECVDRLAQA